MRVAGASDGQAEELEQKWCCWACSRVILHGLWVADSLVWWVGTRDKYLVHSRGIQSAIHPDRVCLIGPSSTDEFCYSVCTCTDGVTWVALIVSGRVKDEHGGGLCISLVVY